MVSVRLCHFQGKSFLLGSLFLFLFGDLDMQLIQLLLPAPRDVLPVGTPVMI